MSRRASAWLWGAVCAALVSSAVPTAEAQEDGAAGKARFGGFMSLGFGGAGVLRMDELDDRVSEDLRVTGGLGVLVDGVIMPYFGLGGLVRSAWWEPRDGANGRATVLDFSVMPRARYPFARGEVYLGVPVGFTLQFVPDTDVNWGGTSIGGLEIDSAIGWNVGLFLGGQVLVTERVGIFGHLGGQFRGANHRAVVRTPFGTFEGDINLRTKQFVMEIGVSYLL